MPTEDAYSCGPLVLSHILNYFVWPRITDEGSVPEMRIWSILFYLLVEVSFYKSHENNTKIRFRITAILQRPKLKHDTSQGSGVYIPKGHHTILKKYEAVHTTNVAENYSSSGMLIIMIKVQSTNRQRQY